MNPSPSPCLRNFQNALFPSCPQNSIIVNPPPVRILILVKPFRDIGRVCIEICQIWLILCQKEHCRKCVSRKYPYPPPPDGRSLESPRGVHGKLLFQRVRTTYKTLKATYDLSKAQRHTYVCCFETKVSAPGH